MYNITIAFTIIKIISSAGTFKCIDSIDNSSASTVEQCTAQELLKDLLNCNKSKICETAEYGNNFTNSFDPNGMYNPYLYYQNILALQSDDTSTDNVSSENDDLSVNLPEPSDVADQFYKSKILKTEVDEQYNSAVTKIKKSLRRSINEFSDERNNFNELKSTLKRYLRLKKAAQTDEMKEYYGNKIKEIQKRIKYVRNKMMKLNQWQKKIIKLLKDNK